MPPQIWVSRGACNILWTNVGSGQAEFNELMLGPVQRHHLLHQRKPRLAKFTLIMQEWAIVQLGMTGVVFVGVMGVRDSGGWRLCKSNQNRAELPSVASCAVGCSQLNHRHLINTCPSQMRGPA